MLYWTKLVVVAVLTCGLSASMYGKTCTWIGPTSGNDNWSCEQNWKDGEAPANGDAIVFSSGTTSVNDMGDITVSDLDFAVSDAFTISGSAKLSLSGNARLGKSVSGGGVTFSCPVELCAGSHTSEVSTVYFNTLSGEGDLWHDGSRISFGNPMPNYFGDIHATNATICPSLSLHYSDNVLGRNNQIHAGRIYIEKNGLGFAASCAIFLYDGKPPATTYLIKNYCGGAVFNGPVTFVKGGFFYTGDATFKDNVYLNGELYFRMSGADHVTVNFEKALLKGSGTANAELNMDQAVKVHFKASGNEFSAVKFWQGNEAIVYLDAADALSHNAHLSFSAPSGGTGRGGVIITGGDQTFKKLSLNNIRTKQFITSTVPAVVTLAANEDNWFYGKLQGDLTFRWSPTWAATFTLGNAEHSLSGKLITDRGTVNLASSVAFPNLSGIDVNGSSKILVPADATFDPNMKELNIATAASLALNDGVHFTVRNLCLNGVKAYAGVYGGEICTYEGDFNKIGNLTGTGWLSVTRGFGGLQFFIR